MPNLGRFWRRVLMFVKLEDKSRLWSLQLPDRIDADVTPDGFPFRCSGVARVWLLLQPSPAQWRFLPHQYPFYCSFWDKLLSRRSSSLTTLFLSLFGISASATLLVWVLRGLRVLTGMPGGVIWLLLILSISMLVMALMPKQSRY